MSQPKIPIAGASVAGLTSAYWFAKAGAQITVMRKMPGLETAVRAKLMPIDGVSFVCENGRPLELQAILTSTTCLRV